MHVRGRIAQNLPGKPSFSIYLRCVYNKNGSRGSLFEITITGPISRGRARMAATGPEDHLAPEEGPLPAPCDAASRRRAVRIHRAHKRGYSTILRNVPDTYAKPYDMQKKSHGR